LRDETDNQVATEPQEEFFDVSFLEELEALSHLDAGSGHGRTEVSARLHEKLAEFMAASAGSADGEQISEDQFAGLSAEAISERTSALAELCRQGGQRDATQAVLSFIVFFQALDPTLPREGKELVRRVFYRLAPTLLNIAHNDFGQTPQACHDGSLALRSLERVLIEIASVRLTPTERDLIFRNIDQLSGFISVADYSVASHVVAEQLLGIIARNRLTRSLFRLMEVEVSIQRYLNAKLGHLTPRIRWPEDVAALGDYGPLRVLQEESADGRPRQFLQVQLPDIPILQQIVLHLVDERSGEIRVLRFDALGSVPIDVPPGTYRLGIVYDPA
jgi:hypothetical protein